MATPKLLKGSFRGVAFGLPSHSMSGGRRVALHEFSGKDNPYAEDLGLKSRTFSLDLFVIGDDFTGRNALIAALEQKGPGVLLHPYLGRVTLQVGEYSLSESYDSQRVAKFAVTFIQPGKLEFPAAVTSASATVSSASTAASLQAASNAIAINTSQNRASASLGSVVASTAALVQTQAKRAALPSGLNSNTATAQAIQLMSAYTSDSNALTGLITTPDLLCYSTADVVFRLSSLGMTSLQAFFAYQRLLGDAAALFAGLHFPATAIGVTMAANASLYQDAVYTAVVGSAASSAVDADFSTYDEAIAVRTALSEMFDVAMNQVTESTLFGYLQDLRAQSLTAIPSPDQALPNVVSVKVASPLPSLVLAHDLMSGSSDEQRLIDLNSARNPWFMPAATNAKVLFLR